MTIRIAQISDMHLLADSSACHYDANPYQNLKLVLSYLNQHQSQFDCVLMTGDMAQSLELATYQLLADAVCRYNWQLPFYWFCGNHDDLTLAEQALNKAPFNSLMQDNLIEFDDWQVLAIDSFKPAERSRYPGEGEISTEQFEQLQQQLAHFPAKHTLLALHHHLVPFNSFIDKYWLYRPAGFTDYLTSNKQVKGLVHGHVHAFSQGEYAGKPFYSCPATSYQYQHNTDTFCVSSTRPGLNLIELKANGEFEVEAEVL